MIYRESCGEKISLLGMGNMRLPTVDGGNGPIDTAAAEKIIDLLYENGVNYFDTAYMYHGGQSEIFIGNALKKYPRDSFFLATKMPSGPLSQGRSPEELFEEQLSKCQVDHFDFYLLHNLNEGSYDVFTNKEKGVIPYLLEQKKRGRIRHLGFSCHAKPETLQRFLDTYDCFEFVQIQLNYFDWEFQNAKLQYEIIRKHGLPVWVMEPCRGGRLASLSDEANQVLKDADPHRSIASWAFRYLFGLEGVHVILSGMTKLEQAQDNLKTFSQGCPLTPMEQSALDKALELFKSQHIIPCTACHYCDGCPMELDIPELLSIYNRYRLSPGPMIWMSLERMKHLPEACISCGACVEKCPQNIPVPDHMAAFAAELSKLPKPQHP